ncbi:SDR family oxidoreductase [Alphaproteobacteria bacterium]|nr:SDR family oxidoreductase [Alphaproteobacteria bacterium]
MKKILIIGGTGVLGEAFSTYLSTKNKVFIADNNLNKLKIISKKFNVNYSLLDVTRNGDIKKTIEKANKQLKGIDVVVHNIAQTSELLLKKYKKFPDFNSIPLSTWESDIAVGLTSAFILAQELDKLWKSNKSIKSLICVSSLYGVVSPNPNLYKDEKFYTLPSYSASKSGLISLVKWLSVYWAKRNIVTNTISPGGIRNKQSKSFIKKYNSLVPVGRMGKEEDILNVLDFLINNESNYLTGQNINVDGGYSSW